MQIWDMGVSVRRGFVLVRVGMTYPSRQPGMDMVVMPVAVAVAVRVKHRLVHVLVSVPCAQHQIKANRH